jgi:transposase-like protein
MINDALKQTIVMERVVDRKPIAALVDEYGVSPASISRWTNTYLKEHSLKLSDADDLITEGDFEKVREENEKLRAENAALKVQYDTLKSMLMDIYRMNNAPEPLPLPEAAE